MAAGSLDPEDFRMTVMHCALDLFEVKGYEATTVDEIADAAGISRRTFFRQFRAKEDVVFVDHDIMLASVQDFLDQPHTDPLIAVCEGATQVFERFSRNRNTALRRYRLVQQVPTLRDREIVMIFRYEGVFMDYLRRARPESVDIDLVQFAAAVTATHNFLLRRWIRGEVDTSPDDVRAALARLRAGMNTAADEVVVAVFPRGTPVDDVTRALKSQLER